MTALVTVLLETLVERTEERIALAGTANLTRAGMLDFPGTSARSWRRWRRRSSCSSSSARRASQTRVMHRRRERVRGPAGRPRSCGPGTARATPSSAAWACSGPTRMDYPGDDRHGECRGTLRRRGVGTELSRGDSERTPQCTTVEDGIEQWPRTTTAFSGCAGTPPPTRSSGPTASWPANSTRTSTRIRRAGEVQRDQRRVRGAVRSEEAPDRRPRRGPARAPAAPPAPGPGHSSASRTSWTRSSATRPRAGRDREPVPVPMRSSGSSSTCTRPRSGSRRRSRLTPPSPARPATAPARRPAPTRRRATRAPAGARSSPCSAPSSVRSCRPARALPAAATARSSSTRARRAAATAVSAARRTLTVKMPAGVEDGMRIRLAGQGEVGPGGGPAGDLYVEIHERPHDIFSRKGDDLHCRVTVPMTAAAFGTRLTIKTLDSEETVDVAPGTQPARRCSCWARACRICAAPAAVICTCTSTSGLRPSSRRRGTHAARIRPDTGGGCGRTVTQAGRIPLLHARRVQRAGLAQVSERAGAAAPGLSRSADVVGGRDSVWRRGKASPHAPRERAN